MKNKNLIVICGPTAVGKTAIAIELAKHFKTAIISADSRQCYKELHVGVAKPTDEQLYAVPHFFINSHSIHDEVNAAVFETFALQTLDELFKKHNTVIVCGGTGLYIKALCNGIDNMPAVATEITQATTLEYEAKGLRWLQLEVEKIDPLFWQNAEQHNPHRLLRALSFFRAHNKSIVHFKTNKIINRPFNIIQLGITTNRKALYNQINNRVLEMIENGLLNEVKSLEAYKHIPALQTVGYSELFSFLNYEITLQKAIELIQQNTRHYAKRQLTWFNKMQEIQWFHQSNTICNNILEHINTFQKS